MNLKLTQHRIYLLSMLGEIAFYIFCITSLSKGWTIILTSFGHINHL